MLSGEQQWETVMIMLGFFCLIFSPGQTMLNCSASCLFQIVSIVWNSIFFSAAFYVIAHIQNHFANYLHCDHIIAFINLIVPFITECINRDYRVLLDDWLVLLQLVACSAESSSHPELLLHSLCIPNAMHEWILQTKAKGNEILSESTICWR